MGAPQVDIGIVGGTGLVGGEVLRLLHERSFPVGRVRVFASDARRGERVEVEGRTVRVEAFDLASGPPPGLLFVAAPAPVAPTFAEPARRAGAFLVDVTGVLGLRGLGPVVVRAVNPDDLDQRVPLVSVACGPAAALALALDALRAVAAPMHVEATLLVPASEAGGAGMEELAAQTINLLNQRDVPLERFPQRLAFNAIPDVGGIARPGEGSTLELRTAQHLRLVLDDESLGVSLTAVRVPIFAGAAAVVRVDLHRATQRAPVVAALGAAPGLVVADDPAAHIYPMPGLMAEQDDVAVGRIRVAGHEVRFVMAWDNLRRGAALDAVELAEAALAAGWLRPRG